MNYNECFKCKKRASGEWFVCLKDDLPHEIEGLLINFIREVHEEIGSGLPNDWIYETIHTCFEDAESGYDYPHKDADSYWRELTEWVSYGFFQHYADKALRENNYQELFDVLQQAQLDVIEEIFDKVVAFLGEHPVEELEQEIEA